MAGSVETLEEAARLCSVPPPASWISSDRDEHAELRGFYHDCGEDIIDRFDFEQAPGLRITYNNVAEGTAYDAAEANGEATNRTALRLGRKAGAEAGLPGPPGAVYNLTRKETCEALAGPQEVEALKGFPSSSFASYYWLTADGGIQFYGADGDDISVLWMTNEWITGPDPRNRGTTIPKTMLSDEDDRDPFPRRAMVNGIVARFRRRHGLDYRALITEYDQILERWTLDRTGTSRVDMTGGERVFDPPDRNIVNNIGIDFRARG